MTERVRDRGRGVAGVGRSAVRPATARALYRGVLEEVDPRVLDAAWYAEGLDDEVTLVRLLLHRQIERDPDNLDLMIKGLHVLVRMVTARHNLTDAEKAALNEGVQRALDQLTANIMGVEAAHG